MGRATLKRKLAMLDGFVSLGFVRFGDTHGSFSAEVEKNYSPHPVRQEVLLHV